MASRQAQTQRVHQATIDAPHAFVASLGLPSTLSDVVASIKDAQKLLDLGDNWDGDGSPGYAERTWHRAVQLVAQSSLGFWQATQSVPPAPAITPGPDGSIDMVWRAGDRGLFVNIPEAPDNIATFYGKDRRQEHDFIQGELDLSHESAWILAWLTS